MLYLCPSCRAGIKVALLTVLASSITFRVLHAFDDLPPISQGTGGPPTLAGLPPRDGSADALATVDLSTGAAQAVLPFLLPKARGKAQPSLALRYDSSAGTGFAGVGWTFVVPSIVRRGAAGFPKFLDDLSGSDPTADRYEFSGSALVPICTVAPGDTFCAGALATEKFPASLEGWTYFRTEIDNGMRFFWSPDRHTWVAQTKSGLQLQFGVPLDPFGPPGLEHADALFMPVPRSKMGDVDDIFRWNLVRQFDTFQNTVYYFWANLQTSADGNARGILYLSDIYDTLPGNATNPTVPSQFDVGSFLHHIHLRWSRDDLYGPLLAQSPIWNQPPANRLLGVDVTAMPLDSRGPRQLVRRYHLDYIFNDAVTRAYLSSFQLEGTCENVSEDSSGLLPDTDCDTLPATTMTYDLPKFNPRSKFNLTFSTGSYSGPVALADFTGTGLPRLVENNMLGVPMEDRNPPPTKRHAKISDIAPGSQHVVMGDWLGDARVNALWLDIDPNDPVHSRNKYEIYSLQAPPESGISSHWLGQGPFDLPNISFPDIPDWQTGRAIDADGDGLVDMGFVPDKTPGGSPFTMRAYFSARDGTGVITPFLLSGSSTCPAPGMFANQEASQFRTMADMDGDGLPDVVVMEPATISGHPVLDVHYMKNRGDGRFGVGRPGGRSCENFANQALTEHLDARTTFTFPMLQFSNVALHDIDGDGVADLIIVSSSGVKICQRSPFIGLVPFTGCVQLDPKNLGWSAQQVANFQPQDVALLFADVDASGVDDLILLAFGDASVIRTHGVVRPGLLLSISNGMGITTSILYDSLAGEASRASAAGNPWKTVLPRPAHVVTSITTTNNLPAPLSQTYETDYSYQDPIYDARDRSFLGFRNVVSHLKGDSNAPGLITTTSFVTDTCPNIAPAAPCGPMADYWFRMRRRLPAVIQDDQESAGQPHLATTVNTYRFQTLYNGLDGRVVRQVFLRQTDAYLWDPSQQNTTQSTVTVMDGPPDNPGGGVAQNETITVNLPNSSKHLQAASRRDLFGNEIAAVDFGELGVDTPILVTRNWGLPPNDPIGWNFRILAQLFSYADISGTASQGEVRETDYSYNSQGLLTTVAAPLKGTLALDRNNGGRPFAPPPPNASKDTPPGSPLVLSKLTYDSFGNVTQSETPNGRCTGIQFDSLYSTFATQTSVFRSGCGADPLTVTRTFDGVVERLTQELDQANLLTVMKYDGFGRLTEVDQPDDLVPGNTAANPAVLIDYSQTGAGPVSKVHVLQISGTQKTPGYDERWTYTDGFGRTLFTLVQAVNTQQWAVQGAHTRSANGRVVQRFEPFYFFGADGSSFPVSGPFGTKTSSFTYNAMGQLVSAAGPDGKSLQYAYHPLALSADIQDSEQQPGGSHAGSLVTAIMDGHGRLVRIKHHMANDPKDNFLTTATYLATGELSSISQTHSGGSGTLLRWMQYDSLGRMVLNAEPNTSANFSPKFTTKLKAWRYAYNDNGELVGTSDARGCGENRFFDKLGRLIAEDYSPCDDFQPTYSPPNLITGDGTEAFYRYDSPEIPDPNPSVYNGRLTAEFDRAQHTRVFLDARGRPTLIERQLAKPGVPNPSLASRYAPHFFQKQFTAYDEANRPLTETTGAETPELRPPHLGSSVTTLYASGGAVAGVSSTYGALISSQNYDANGAVLQTVYGDIARTTADLSYYPNNQLFEMHVHRRAGPWLSPGAGYTLPGPNDPNTLQGDLFDLKFQYDGTGNPILIFDSVDPSTWPAGAKPASRVMIYDDMYRLRQIGNTYDEGDDPFLSPFAPEVKRGDPTFPPLVPTPSRVRTQTFQYDSLGNVTSSSDDAQVFLDRSLGTATYGTLSSGPHRLRIASLGQSNLTVGYDLAGNSNGITVNRPSPCTVPCQTQYLFAWDEIGNLSGASRQETSGQIPNIVAQTSYSYDASGNRVLKTRLDPLLNETRYSAVVFDSLRLDDATFPDSGGNYEQSTATENVYLNSNGGRFAHVFYDTQASLPTGPSGQVHVAFGLSDYLGSTSVVIDRDTSEVIERSTYHALGAPETDYRPDRWGNFRERYRYTGHEDDSDVGLIYFGQRYYSPEIGMWLSPDPMTIHGIGADSNPYAFVSRSPLLFTDPIGLDTYGCDNLNPSCSFYYSDEGSLLNAIASAWNDLTGGGVSGGGGSGRGGGVNQPTIPPPPGQVSAPNWFMDWGAAFDTLPTLRLNFNGIAGEFNAGIDKHALELVSATGLALVEGAIVTMAAEGPGLYVNTGRAASWFTNLSLAEQGIVVGGGGGTSAFLLKRAVENLENLEGPALEQAALNAVANELKAAGPPLNAQTINLLSTTEGSRILTVGGQSLTALQRQVISTRYPNLIIGSEWEGFDAEIRSLATAGELQITPAAGYATNNVCAHCQLQLRNAAEAGGYKFILQNGKSYIFKPPK